MTTTKPDFTPEEFQTAMDKYGWHWNGYGIGIPFPSGAYQVVGPVFHRDGQGRIHVHRRTTFQRAVDWMRETKFAEN